MLGTLTFETAIGTCGLAFTGNGLAAVVLPSQTETATRRALERVAVARKLGEGPPVTLVAAATGAVPEWVLDAIARIVALLGGETVDLHDIRLDTRNLTPFAERVYDAARAIPQGGCTTYGELGRTAGFPKSARAVGRAMATNPWPIVVPCHRVVSSQGSLQGFSAPGGVRTKAAMLDIERRALGGAPAELVRPARKHSKRAAQVVLPFGR